MVQIKTLYYAIISGMFGAFASVFGKLAGNPNSIIPLIYISIPLWIIRIISTVAIVLCNVLMLYYFTIVLSGSKSSTIAMGFNLAGNFLASAIVGSLVFRESIGITWLCGATLIIIGTTLLHKNNDL